jgi:hypothetical protein
MDNLGLPLGIAAISRRLIARTSKTRQQKTGRQAHVASGPEPGQPLVPRSRADPRRQSPLTKTAR